jgi:hypothetical protein
MGTVAGCIVIIVVSLVVHSVAKSWANGGSKEERIRKILDE